MDIFSPKDFKVCGGFTDCPHQKIYDMNARDNHYYDCGYDDGYAKAIEDISNGIITVKVR